MARAFEEASGEGVALGDQLRPLAAQRTAIRRMRTSVCRTATSAGATDAWDG